MPKPLKLAKLQKKKSIGSAEGFADTFNWIVEWISNVTGKRGVKIEDPTSSNPTIAANLVAGEGIEIEPSGEALKISATGGGEGGDVSVTVTGTNGVTATGKTVVFASAVDSNVQANVSSVGDVITVTLGVYYS